MLNKFAKFMRNTGPIRFLAPLGIILLVMGIVMLATSPDKYDVTTGTVTNVEAHEEDDKTLYNVDFDYTVGGKKLQGAFYDLDKEYKVGDKIDVYYDPAKPESISNSKNTRLFAVGMIGVGAVALAYGIYSTVKAFKKSRELDERTKAAAGSATLPEITPLPKEQLTEYYVSLDGINLLKPGYIMEDRDRKVIYEAPMTKNAAVGDRIFTFNNRVTGTSVEHKVGHTTTASYNNEFFSVKSWFKFDGKNIWDVLHDKGIRVSTDILSKFPNVTYHAALNGKFFATIQTSGQYVHEEDAAEHSLNVPMGSYYYRVWTNESDLDLLFLTIFALSESDQVFVE